MILIRMNLGFARLRLWVAVMLIKYQGLIILKIKLKILSNRGVI